MLNGARLGKELWEVAIDNARYLKNSSPTLVLVEKNPHGVCFGKNPYITHLKFFIREILR